LAIVLSQQGEDARVSLALPRALAALGDAALFHAAAPAPSQICAASMFGTGFALRLADAEARAAGGTLIRESAQLTLILPGVAEATALRASPVGGA